VFGNSLLAPCRGRRRRWSKPCAVSSRGVLAALLRAGVWGRAAGERTLRCHRRARRAAMHWQAAEETLHTMQAGGPSLRAARTVARPCTRCLAG